MHRFINFIPGRHDDQHIDVTKAVRFAVSVGAKQDDALGLKALGKLIREATNRRQGYPLTKTPGRGFVVEALACHR
jgi:hypothetical protein